MLVNPSNIKRLILYYVDKGHLPIILAFRETLEYLELTFFSGAESKWLLRSQEWFLPKLKEMKISGRYHSSVKFDLVNHIPGKTAISYDPFWPNPDQRRH